MKQIIPEKLIKLISSQGILPAPEPKESSYVQTMAQNYFNKFIKLLNDIKNERRIAFIPLLFN